MTFVTNMHAHKMNLFDERQIKIYNMGNIEGKEQEMEPKVIIEKQDLTYLKWSHGRNSSGTAGTFLKSQSSVSGEKIYYKLSNFDSEKGIVGHECVNEIIVDRLLTLLGVEHLSYQLIHADIEVDGKVYDTWICASRDFKEKGESKAALDNYYQINRLEGESRYDFCVRQGWGRYVDVMLAVDYLILNRDRHGANVEVLRNGRKRTLRIAPLFDHGVSLLFSCRGDGEFEAFDVIADKPCQNFIGSRSTFDNLELIEDKAKVFPFRLKLEDKGYILKDLEHVLSEPQLEKIWETLWVRWCEYEKLCNL